ncbi:MAG TPA: TetR/AcrR family transcriptional regulator [Deltaproteobacteria bacterium]|nr:TetR/AcrR family transcriptional regulator [Deltaproteobacteria bacterium]
MTFDGPGSREGQVGLRKKPRQARAEERIGQLLDAAERVVERIGYEALTTNHVAEEAGVSIGTVYRWFPDKHALATRLSERYVETVLADFEALVVDDPDLPAPPLLERVVLALADLLAEHPSVQAILRGASGQGQPGVHLRETLIGLAERIVEIRVIEIPPEERRLTAEAMVATTLAFLAHPTRSARDREWVEELVYLLSAYAARKYPPRDDPAWTTPGAGPRPVRPGVDAIVSDRRASKTSGDDR